jgi:hypothetical protein
MGGFLSNGGRFAASVLAAAMLMAHASGVCGQVTKESKQRGKVIDADGKPVTGADVYLVRGNSEPVVLATAKTDGQGAFEINSPDEVSEHWSYDLQTYVPGKGVGDERYQASKEYVIQLKPTSRITLTMLDPDGKPIPGMKVYPRVLQTSVGLNWSREKMFFMRPPRVISDRLAGTTDEKGRVTLSDMPRGMRLQMGFDDERFAYPGFDKRAYISDDQEQSPTVTYQLLAGATVSGVVRYGDTGKGAAGFQVEVQATSRTFDAGRGGGGTTDANGAYRIAHLPPGEYNVMLRLDEQGDWAAAGHEWVKLSGGAVTSNIDFTLIKGGTIKGKVITTDTAEQLANVWIGVQGPGHPQGSGSIQQAKTDAEGVYSIRVPPGLQHVFLQGPVPQAYTQPRQEIKDIKVDEGETVRLDFRLQRQEGETVNGVVIGLDGKPAADVAVQAQTGTGAFGSSTKTNAQGHFHFDAIPVGTPIEVKSGELATAEPVEVQKGQGEIRLQLVRRMKVDLKGLVTDEDDKPISRARVYLSQIFGRYGEGESEPRLTGPDGRYEIRNLYTDNHYEINADADGFGERRAMVEMGSDTKALPTLKLPRATATTGGVVVDEAGKPVQGVAVHLNMGGISPKTCVTDAQGKFSFQVVPGTNHLIWIAVKERGKVGPNVMGSGGRNDLKLLFPKDEQ